MIDYAHVTSGQLLTNYNLFIMIIFRVETRYGIWDAYSLREAKENSSPSDHIQAVAPDGLTVLSRVVRKSATPSWAIKICKKFGFNCII